MVLTEFTEAVLTAAASSSSLYGQEGNYSADSLAAATATPPSLASMLATTSTQFLLSSSTSTMEPEQYASETTYIIVSTVVPIFFGFIGITGLLGNALVVLVVLSNPGMRSTTNLLIINLAIADLLFVVFCVPFTGSDYVLEEWPYGDIWCRVVQYLIVVTAHASIYTLVLMSLDRFLAVVHPIASMVVRTEAHTMRAICILWFLILTTAIPVLFMHGEHVSAIAEEQSVCDGKVFANCNPFNGDDLKIFHMLHSFRGT